MKMENNSDNVQIPGADLEKMYSFLEECCEKVKTVDISTAWLFSSVDLIHSRTEKLVQQVDVAFANAEPTKDVIQILQECKEIFLLFEDTALQAKVETVESLSTFLDFIIKFAKENVNTRIVSSCSLLSNRKYSNVSNKHKEKYIHRLLNANDEMQNEISQLKKLIRLSDDKERTFIVERNSQNEMIEQLESNATLYENERDKAQIEIEVLKKQNETSLKEQNEEIESLKERLSAEEDNCCRKKKQNDELIDTLETLQAEHNEKVQDYEEMKKSFENEVKSLQKEIEGSDKVKNQLKLEIESSRRETKQREDALQEVKINFEKCEEECMRKVNEGEVNLRRKDQEIDHLNKNVKDREISETHLKQQYENEKTLLNEANEELVKKIETMRNQLNEIENEKCSLNERIMKIQYDLNREIEEKHESIERLTICKVDLEKELETSQDGLESYRNKYERLSDELEEGKRKSQRLNDLLHEKEQENISIEQDKQILLRQRDELNSEYEELTKKTKLEKENLQAQLTKVDTNMKLIQIRMKNDKDSHETEICQKDDRIAELKRKYNQMYEEKEDVSKVLIAIEKELEGIKCKRIMQVQLYSQTRTSLTGIVEQGLVTLLKEKLESEKLELDFVQCAKASDIQPDIPLLLLCITVSRLGTDVANAVQGLTLSPKMAVLIFHHKDVHALPNQDSGRVLTGQGLKNLGGVFDMAFLSGKGIYNCEMNNINVISLINFINREGLRKAIHET